MNANPEVSEPVGKPLSLIKKIGLAFLFLILLFLFTLTKLPQAKITGLIQGTIQSALDPYGILITDQGRTLSIWRGFEYRLDHPVLELPDQSRVELEEMIITPSLMPLFSGKAGARIEITQVLEKTPSKTDLSKITIVGSGRGDLIDATIQLDQLDLGKFGILNFAGGVKGSGQLSGDIHVDGRLADLPSLTGYLNLKLRRFRIDEQNLFGFQLPSMEVKEGTLDVLIQGGKLLMKQVRLGKTDDDLQLDLTGDISLNRNLNASVLNLRTTFGFSEKVRQSISLLDSLIAQAKQADGQYAYKLTGSFSAPFPMPDPKK